MGQAWEGSDQDKLCAGFLPAPHLPQRGESGVAGGEPTHFQVRRGSSLSHRSSGKLRAQAPRLWTQILHRSAQAAGPGVWEETPPETCLLLAYGVCMKPSHRLGPVPR